MERLLDLMDSWLGMRLGWPPRPHKVTMRQRNKLLREAIRGTLTGKKG